NTKGVTERLGQAVKPITYLIRVRLPRTGRSLARDTKPQSNYTAETTPLEVLTLHRYDAALNWTSDEKRPPRPHLWG
ncbi:hypothetical protein Taro_007001, partial [Colocasia esculenta]|nr:hypothetical protein [Colocasia esculenta]